MTSLSPEAEYPVEPFERVRLNCCPNDWRYIYIYIDFQFGQFADFKQFGYFALSSSKLIVILMTLGKSIDPPYLFIFTTLGRT